MRQHVYTDHPLIVYEGLGLARVEGPQPFCGPNFTNLAIHKVKQLSTHLAELMKEPAVAMHVVEITPENIDFERSQPFLRNQLQLTRDFLPRFTSVVNVEIYFGKQVGSRNPPVQNLTRAQNLARVGLDHYAIRAILLRL